LYSNKFHEFHRIPTNSMNSIVFHHISCTVIERLTLNDISFCISLKKLVKNSLSKNILSFADQFKISQILYALNINPKRENNMIFLGFHVRTHGCITSDLFKILLNFLFQTLQRLYRSQNNLYQAFFKYLDLHHKNMTIFLCLCSRVTGTKFHWKNLFFMCKSGCFFGARVHFPFSKNRSEDAYDSGSQSRGNIHEYIQMHEGGTMFFYHVLIKIQVGVYLCILCRLQNNRRYMCM